MEENRLKFVIDRIEGEIAVCENLETKEIVEILVINLPEESKEGRCLTEENGAYKIDFSLAEERRRRIEEKRKKLWKK